MLEKLPDDILKAELSTYLTAKEKARLASVSRKFYRLFQTEIGKQEATEAAECAIYPTKENVEKLEKLLKACPALLLHPMQVKNRHGMKIKGTVYQIALHEVDNELIDDVIKPAFEKLHHGLEKMEAQRQTWFPKGWEEAEENTYANAMTAIDNVFTAFKNASYPNDVTESPKHPYTITINNQAVNEVLNTFRESITLLYQPTDKVITSGRDTSIRLHTQVLARYNENYDTMGAFDSPRNNAIMRSVFGFTQRFAPINFMQAFAQGIYYIVEEKRKLIRSFEYSNWTGHSILPLDQDSHFRLGHEFFARGGRSLRGRGGFLQTFFQSKTAAALQTCYAITEKALHKSDKCN